MTCNSVHAQLRVAVENSGLSAWELSRKANVRQSLVDRLIGEGGSSQLEALERVADALELDVMLAQRRPQLRSIGEVPSVVDAAVMRAMPERCVTAVQNGPSVLALDLEGVLISSAVSVFPRPGLYRFLACCRGLFERVVMFTTLNELRFRQIASLLVGEGAAPAWFESIDYVTWHGKTKDLRFVPAVSIGQVLLVDDLEDYVDPQQREQWVPVAGFEPPFTQADAELDRVLEELARRACPKP